MSSTEADRRFVPLPFDRLEPAEMQKRSREFFERMNARRSVRFFTDEPIPDGVLDDCILTAGSAPSGAHRQPWTFVVVTDPDVKREIRIAAEAEERETYANRMSDEWREALHPIGTDWQKPFLEIAPALVIVMRHVYGVAEGGGKQTNYYTQESVGIASGMLLAALHNAGLATLTHTPSPMGFLAKILERPEYERPYLLIPVGYPTEDCVVPDFERKPLDEIRVER